jgi:hypothetical protein
MTSSVLGVETDAETTVKVVVVLALDSVLEEVVEAMEVAVLKAAHMSLLVMPPQRDHL